MDKRKKNRCVICGKPSFGKKCIDCFSNKHLGVCGLCGKKLTFKFQHKTYCDSCERIVLNKKLKLRYIYLQKKAIGTVDISPHLCRDKYGTPLWENEKKVIKYIKKKLFYWGNCINFDRGFSEAHGYDWYHNLRY